jgi:hypothetical protein
MKKHHQINDLSAPWEILLGMAEDKSIFLGLWSTCHGAVGVSAPNPLEIRMKYGSHG